MARQVRKRQLAPTEGPTTESDLDSDVDQPMLDQQPGQHQHLPMYEHLAEQAGDDGPGGKPEAEGAGILRSSSTRIGRRQMHVVLRGASVCLFALVAGYLVFLRGAQRQVAAQQQIHLALRVPQRRAPREHVHEPQEDLSPEVPQLVAVERDAQSQDAEQDTARVPVCLRAPNPRVASVFLRNYLHEFGGKLDFVPAQALREMVRGFEASGALARGAVDTSRKCEAGWPVLSLVFQNTVGKGVRPPGTRFVVGDEMCRCTNAACSDTSKVAMRQYFMPGDAPPFLPLGPRFEFEPVDRAALLTPSERPLLFNFVGAATSDSRRELLALLEAPETEARQTLLGKGFVHVAPRWKKDAAAGAGYLPPAKFREVLLNSTFTLCPAGNNPEAFRIYEAVDSGSIPVIALDEMYRQHACRDAFQPLLASGAPFVMLGSWRELPDKLAELASDPQALDDLQQDLAAWRKMFWRETRQQVECAVLGGQPAALGARAILERECGAVGSSDARDSLVSKPIPLVTGCGRSGTFSVAKLLNSMGIEALHENMRAGAVSVSWLYAADAAKYPFELASSRTERKRALRLKPDGAPLFGPVVLLTRHPLKVMSSTRRCFCGIGDRDRPMGRRSDAISWRFVERFLSGVDASSEPGDLRRSAVYWLDWNALIEDRYPDHVHMQLETLDPKQLVVALGKSDEVANLDALPTEVANAAFHHSPAKMRERFPDVTWSELHELDAALAQRVLDRAQRYGYEVGKTLDELLSAESKE